MRYVVRVEWHYLQTERLLSVCPNERKRCTLSHIMNHECTDVHVNKTDSIFCPWFLFVSFSCCELWLTYLFSASIHKLIVNDYLCSVSLHNVTIKFLSVTARRAFIVHWDKHQTGVSLNSKQFPIKDHQDVWFLACSVPLPCQSQVP